MVQKNIYGINHKMISIVIPTYNNLNYLKLCLKSLKKNSSFNHEIIIHINDGSDGTLDFVKTNNYKYTISNVVNLEANYGALGRAAIIAHWAKFNCDKGFP